MKFKAVNFTMGVIVLSLVSCNSTKKEVKKENHSVVSNLIQKVLVGTYTSDTSEGIYTIDFNSKTGELSNKQLVAVSENPSFLTQSKDGIFVYAVNENDPGTVASYKWNKDRTQLIPQETITTEGMHPCFVSLNSPQNQLAVANYSSGNIAVYTLEDGQIKDKPQVRNHEGNSVLKPFQDTPHAHCSKFSKDSKFIYVADLGIDEVVAYSVNERGELSNKSTALKMDAGDGPRHFIYHPTKEIVYIISEFSNSVTVASIDSKKGTFTKIGKVSTLPEDFKGDSYCADVQISSDGKFLYGSNRGHNSIATFSVGEDGMLELLATESVQGDWPRNFALSTNEKFLLVANQKSDNITVLNRNAETGLLSFTGNELKLSKPVCLKFN